jgi:hypothetical protein
LANYLTNLPGFTPSTDRLQYKTLDLRSIYQSNFGRYPLVPDSAGASYSRTGVLRAGSGRHVLITRSPSSAEVTFTLTAGDGSSPVSSTAQPRIALARVR